MKKTTAAVAVAGTTVVAALGAVGAAGWPKVSHVDVMNVSSEWTFTPDNTDLEHVDLVQAPLRSQLEWVVPGTFSNGDETLTGELLIRPTGGTLYQPDFQFVTPGYGDLGDPNNVITHPDSALYAYGSPTGSGYGVSAYYFAPNGAHDATGSAAQFNDTLFGNIHLDSGSSWLLHPADYTDAITYSDILGIGGATHDGVTPVPFGDVLALGPGGSGDWTLTPGDMTPVMYQNMPIWHFGDASYIDGGTTLDGTVYLNSSPISLGLYNEEFVTTGGALYDYNQGWFGFDNMYYSPGDGGSVVDILKTPLGDWNMSWLSWLFTPPDYAGVSASDAAGVLSGMLGSSVLSGTIDFGQSVADASGSAADVAGAVADALGAI